MDEALLAPLTTLERVPGLRIQVVNQPNDGQHMHGDAIVEVRSLVGSDRYVAEAKRSVSMRTLPSILSQLRQVRHRTDLAPLLLAAYIPPTVARALQVERIAFADAAGNVHLDGPAAYVWIGGHGPTAAPTRSGLTFTDLLLTFALLRQPDLVARPLRDIAETTGVSLGKVSATLGILEGQRYVARRQGQRRILLDARRLLDRWELGYLEVVRPRLHATTWRLPPTATVAATVDRAAEVSGALVGGEHAADAFTRYLKPETLTLHVPPGETKLVAARLRLHPAEHPHQVVLLERFAKPLDEADGGASPQGPFHGRLIHPILARVELLAQGSDRLREVADRLRDEVILPGFPSDG